jgi:hypothetical protein
MVHIILQWLDNDKYTKVICRSSSESHSLCNRKPQYRLHRRKYLSCSTSSKQSWWMAVQTTWVVQICLKSITFPITSWLQTCAKKYICCRKRTSVYTRVVQSFLKRIARNSLLPANLYQKIYTLLVTNKCVHTRGEYLKTTSSYENMVTNRLQITRIWNTLTPLTCWNYTLHFGSYKT